MFHVLIFVCCMVNSFLSASQKPSEHLVDPNSVHRVSLDHINKQLAELDKKTHILPDWKTIKASGVYKKHKQLVDRTEKLYQEVQKIKQELETPGLPQNEKELLESVGRQLDSAFFGSSTDLVEFESEKHVCPLLLDEQTLYAQFWRAKYESMLQEKKEQKK